MKAEKLPNEFNIKFYAEGLNPSARDIQNLCAAFEAACIIAHINFAKEKDLERYWDLERSFGSYVESKRAPDAESIHQSINALTTLSLSTVLALPTSKKDNSIGRDYELSRHINHSLHLLERISMRSETHKRLSDGADFHNFNEWIADEFGNRLLETAEVNTTNSIEFIFNICSMAAILGFQNAPELKETILYIEATIKGWLQKSDGKVESSNIKLPPIPSSLAKTIAKYDDVEISSGPDGWKISLKR